MQVTVNGTVRNVEIEYRRNRNMYLRIREDGALFVTCPRYVTHAEIEKFIQEKAAWIRRTENKLKNREEKILTGTNREYLTWMGRKLPVEFQTAGRNRLEIHEDKAVFYLKDINDAAIEQIFYKAAGDFLKQAIEECRKFWDREICEKNGLPFPAITIRYMTSRWGSCMTTKNHINISLRLIHFSAFCLDYVLLHEYTHLLVPNHSKDFYNIVKYYMPEYKEAVKLLK